MSCDHVKATGESAIVFRKKKWFGVFPRKYVCICTICGEVFDLDEEQYRLFKKGGESDEANK